MLFSMRNFKEWKITKIELNPETSLLRCQLCSVLDGRVAHWDGVWDPLWNCVGVERTPFRFSAPQFTITRLHASVPASQGGCGDRQEWGSARCSCVSLQPEVLSYSA